MRQTIQTIKSMILFVMLLFPIYYFFSFFALDTTNIESILPLQSGYTLTEGTKLSTVKLI